MSFPVDLNIIKLESCKYEDMSKFTSVFNINQFNDIIWIHIPDSDSKYLTDISIREMYQSDFIQYSRELSYPWMYINSSELNKSPGQHIYEIKLKDSRYLEGNCYLYFSYIIQDDNPDKPYIYMDR